MCLDKESDNNGTMVGGNVRKRSGFIKRAKGRLLALNVQPKKKRKVSSFGSNANANLVFCPLGSYFSLLSLIERIVNGRPQDQQLQANHHFHDFRDLQQKTSVIIIY